MSKLSSKRLLTKSRFKTGYECPTKLFYSSHKEYGNVKSDDEFLKSLARGGFQVGALAREYFPGGVAVETLDAGDALEQTKALLAKDSVVIFEAAIQFKNFFIRVDVLRKNKNSIELIEVKAKSCNSNVKDEFCTKKGGIASAWEPYLIDIAFQKWVTTHAIPKSNVTASLMLANKDQVASVDGLNQLFMVQNSKDGLSQVVKAKNITRAELGEKILFQVNVDEECDIIWAADYESKSFEQFISILAELHFNDQRVKAEVKKACKSCEFRIGKEMKSEGLKSGFEQCWREATSLKNFDKPLVFDIWNWRGWEKLLNDGVYLASEIQDEDIKDSVAKDTGLSNSDRQKLQLSAIKENSIEPYLDLPGLKSELKSFTHPLHFIDFETTMVAIPFLKGRRPYEQIAFQFSHHVMEKNGSVVHRTQYLNAKRGKFPNFDFVRNLKKALEDDNGTILRYSNHENTVLNQIHAQLEDSSEKDRADLCKWIETITLKKEGKEVVWEGKRNMVDLCELVKKYYYSPLSNGSNSIKKVLPAVLNSSPELYARYSQAIYGGGPSLTSLNLKNHAWLSKDQDGKVIDPYNTLPKLREGLDRESLDRIFEYEEIDDGGAAMTAYAMMQFTQMSEQERGEIETALLRYCELDTLAMVMIVEYWQWAIKSSKSKVA